MPTAAPIAPMRSTLLMVLPRALVLPRTPSRTRLASSRALMMIASSAAVAMCYTGLPAGERRIGMKAWPESTGWRVATIIGAVMLLVTCGGLLVLASANMEGTATTRLVPISEQERREVFIEAFLQAQPALTRQQAECAID